MRIALISKMKKNSLPFTEEIPSRGFSKGRQAILILESQFTAGRSDFSFLACLLRWDEMSPILELALSLA